VSSRGPRGICFLRGLGPHLFSKRTNWDLTPNPLSQALAARRAAGLPIIDLTASNPTECGFTYDSEAILAALSNPLSLTYQPEPRGLLSAREAVCAYYADRGDNVSPDNVVLTTSTSEAYSFIFRLLCNPGDEVLVPQPSYPLFDFLADLDDVRLVRYPLLYDHGWQIDFHSLQQSITERTRAIIVVHPNNPTGNFCKPHEVARLNEICAARGLAIIADEVFLDYPLHEVVASSLPNVVPKAPPQSFATNPAALTFTLSGISKICGLPQMKAAWLAASGPEAAVTESLKRLEVIADTFLSMNAPVQHALPALLQARHPLQAQLQQRLAANVAEVDVQLARQQTCARLELEGGWYTVLALPTNCASDALAVELLVQEGVYFHPGHFYDFMAKRHAVASLISSPGDFSSGIGKLLSAVSSGVLK
jgi:alanine-synthesizing transaminase